MKGLLEWLVEKPTAYLEEMREYLYNEYNVICTKQTVYVTLERSGWSRKVASKHAKARSEALWQHFHQVSRTWQRHQIVAIDESAANERTANRKRGWSPVGEGCVSEYFGTRSRRCSVIPAMDVNGYFA